MAGKVLLKDQLFNRETVGQLAREYAAALPQFDATRFQQQALSGLAGRELLARLEWLADCVEAQLPTDFEAMAEQLEAAMPPPLDPDRTDDDFGRFIHALPGVLAARHGLENHRDRALDLLYRATQRFSMEFYIRPFLCRWPEETLRVLHDWAEDDHYHVRRLVSEGTRPRLPWARAGSLDPARTLPLLDKLHADRTRFVTRSVANHLNDLSKSVPDTVISRLTGWASEAMQSEEELNWMTRHALRTLLKAGHGGALQTLGYRADAPLAVSLELNTPVVRIGDALEFSCSVRSDETCRLLVDYRICFARPNGREGEKVFKLKAGEMRPEAPFRARKRHPLKADATTFTWHPGPHRLILQINGVDRAEAAFDVV